MTENKAETENTFCDDYDKCWGINAPRMIFESFNQQIMVIDSQTGTYYALEGMGAQLFVALVDGISPQQILDCVLLEEGKSVEVKDALSSYFNSLRNECLFVVTGDVQGDATFIYEKPFTQPQLKIFTDMKDYLLMDPIHDVDQSWPNKKNP
jgi:hypothetical protein